MQTHSMRRLHTRDSRQFFSHRLLHRYFCLTDLSKGEGGLYFDFMLVLNHFDPGPTFSSSLEGADITNVLVTYKGHRHLRDIIPPINAYWSEKIQEHDRVILEADYVSLFWVKRWISSKRLLNLILNLAHSEFACIHTAFLVSVLSFPPHSVLVLCDITSETAVSLHCSPCTKPWKRKKGSITYCVLHLGCQTESPLRRTPPP